MGKLSLAPHTCVTLLVPGLEVRVSGVRVDGGAWPGTLVTTAPHRAGDPAPSRTELSHCGTQRGRPQMPGPALPLAPAPSPAARARLGAAGAVGVLLLLVPWPCRRASAMSPHVRVLLAGRQAQEGLESVQTGVPATRAMFPGTRLCSPTSKTRG